MDKKRPNKAPNRRERPDHQAITVHLYSSKPHNALILKYLSDQGMSLSDAVINALHHSARHYARRIAVKRYGRDESEVAFLTDEELHRLLTTGGAVEREVKKPLAKIATKPIKETREIKKEVRNESSPDNDDDVDY